MSGVQYARRSTDARQTQECFSPRRPVHPCDDDGRLCSIQPTIITKRSNDTPNEQEAIL